MSWVAPGKENNKKSHVFRGGQGEVGRQEPCHERSALDLCLPVKDNDNWLTVNQDVSKN